MWTGAWAAQLAGDNQTAYSKLWLERTVLVQPNTTYAVHLAYEFCCVAALGDPQWYANIADVRPEPAADHEPDFEFHWPTAFEDSTSGATGPEALWRHREYDLLVRSGADGRLYVSVGLRYAFETTYRYSIDDVQVMISPQ